MPDVPAPSPDPAVARIIENVLEGAPLREAARAAGLSLPALHRRLAQDKGAAQAYARASEMRADVLADEALHIADGDDDPAKVRNQIQVRQWLASKLYARRYGDRIDLNVTQVVDIGATLAEARARLRPVRDLGDVIDAETVDSTGVLNVEPCDNQSLAPPAGAADAEPDIFS